MTKQEKIVPVILAGGSGTRLWPISREDLPKQYCSIDGEDSLLGQTLSRVSDREIFNDPVIICNQEHIDLVKMELEKQSINARAIIGEPVGRNTMSAVALSLRVLERDPDCAILVLPSDHKIRNTKMFLKSVLNAQEVVEKHNSIVAFGVKPTYAETGYGYIRAGQKLDNCFGSNLDTFIEKPNKIKAEKLILEDKVFWNAGMFIFRHSCLMQECMKIVPEIMDNIAASLPLNSSLADVICPNFEEFSKNDNVSFDIAIMEVTDRAATVPILSDWNDMGSWKAIWEDSRRDDRGNAARGRAYNNNSSDTYIATDGPVVGVNGLSNIAVIAQRDAILVTSLDHTQEIKGLLEIMKHDDVDETTHHSGEKRPWGTFDSLDKGGMHKVKRICVKPNGRLSLQYHHHRAEHWIVVSGTPTVTVDDEVLTLSVGQQIYIPQGAVHRLENFSDSPAEIIEVQIGTYFGEDDIVRVEDVYGRQPEPVKSDALKSKKVS